MITYASRDDILANLTGDIVADAIGRHIILSGDRDATRYGLIADGNARGYIVRVDYVGESAREGISRVRVVFPRDESRADNLVTFGRDSHIMGRTASNNMGIRAAGQCDCGSFHCAH